MEPSLTKKIQVLSAARQRISKPESFIQGRLHNENHTAFCARGAIIEEAPDDTYYTRELAKLLDCVCIPHVIKDNKEFYKVVTYNNSHSHSDVLALFDATITRLKRELVIEDLKEARVILEAEGEWKVLESV